jgi:hypothetical protein
VSYSSDNKQYFPIQHGLCSGNARVFCEVLTEYLNVIYSVNSVNYRTNVNTVNKMRFVGFDAEISVSSNDG